MNNFGTAEARGVTVSFLLDKLQANYGHAMPPPASVTDVKKAGGQESFTWVVGTIPAGGSNTLSFGTSRNSTAPVPTSSPFYVIGSISAEASSQTFEPSGLKDNNVRKVWAYSGRPTGLSLHMVNGRLGLFLSVDNLRPTSGSPDVGFGLTARSSSPGARAYRRYSGVIADIEISVELSAGLKFKDGWTPPSGFTKTGSRSATWSPENVTGDTTNTDIDANAREIDIETALTGDSLQSIPLEERCITARVADSKPPPEPGYIYGSLKQCLGDDPPVLFREGSLAFLTSFPCVGGGTHQCQNDPGIAIAARVPPTPTGGSDADRANLRSKGVGRTDEGRPGTTAWRGTTFLDPEAVIIQIRDQEGRVQDSNANRVAGVSWQTARDAHSDISNRPVRGVSIHYTRTDIKDASAWNSLGPRTLTVSGVDGGAAPGGVKIRLNGSRKTFFDLAAATSVTKNAFNINSVSNSVVHYFADFETLGTYFIDYSLTMTDASSTEYTDTARYTFHVGPIAELEVRDGGNNAELASGQRAFTIVAVNNGPDDAPSAQVTVAGLTEGDVVSHSATAGSFDPGTGVWSIGELRESSHYQDNYRRDGEVLTIVTSDDASAKITAEIENTRDYQVCIDSSGEDVELSTPSMTACTTEDATNTWHTTEYYDYISDNNSATIIAAGGTGAALLSRPETEAVTAIRVTWDPVAEVNGWPVTHYEVQRRTNPWETVAEAQDPFYFDLDVVPGQTHEYRVRAVNDREQSGPWSGSVEGTVPQVVTAPLPTGPVRILRIEPSISDVSLRGGDLVRLAVEVYGRQDLRDDSLGDRTDVTFDWTLEEFGVQPGGTVGRLVGPESSNNDRARTSTLDGRRVLYIAPDSPGRFRITVSLEPGTECLPKQSLETEEEAQERCTAVFEITALRSSEVETATLNPRNPAGAIPPVLADSEGFQYEVFTPVNGGAFVHESASLIAGAGAVPDYEMIGLRISEAGPALNEGATYGRYTLGGDWYAITAVDASGRRVEESYELNDVLDVCVPLPAELSSNISDLAMVAMNSDDSLTILASRVRISMSGTQVCGYLSTVPGSVAIGTAGAPKPLPTAFPETPAQTGFPDAGGLAPPSQTVLLWMALIGLTVLVAVLGFMLVRRRRKMDRIR